ncbi:MAG: DUF3899 domain-containing protein [Candidatus Izemoplasmatales bacterium]|nr:DUF3899 domain-containing protein [Candidatus Izemoplasmatales bacterium]
MVLIIMFAFFEGDFSFLNDNLQNTIFIVGIILTSAGLLTATGASRIFRGVGFVFKRMFTRKVDGLSYYEYLLMKDDKRERYQGLPLLIVGIAFVILSLFLYQ